MLAKRGKLPSKLQTDYVSINRCLRRIINIRWTEPTSNEDLWKITKQQPTAIQIKMRKWRRIGYTLREPTGSIEKAALDWNPQGARSSHGSGDDMERR
jgi:hypothetical protein